MKKRLAIKVDEYEKDGKTKGKYVNVGVILENDNGEYALLDPSVDLAGALMQQRVLNHQKQVKSKGDMVMCSIFTDDKPARSDSGHSSDFDNEPPF